MALTMTRTRTQTALNKLAQRTAELHDELAFLDELLASSAAVAKAARLGQADVELALTARQSQVTADRDALYTALRQFDSEIDPTEIGRSDAWRKQMLPRARAKGVGLRYMRALAAQNASSLPLLMGS